MKTNEELNALFAGHVCGWNSIYTSQDGVARGLDNGENREDGNSIISDVPDYCSSFDLVLPYLEGQNWRCQHDFNDTPPDMAYWFVLRDSANGSASAESLPKAAVLALLRSREVEA